MERAITGRVFGRPEGRRHFGGAPFAIGIVPEYYRPRYAARFVKKHMRTRDPCQRHREDMVRRFSRLQQIADESQDAVPDGLGLPCARPDRRFGTRDPAYFPVGPHPGRFQRSEEHTSELQSLMRNSYAVL